jgi:isoleucyl-tRNA synthetase
MGYEFDVPIIGAAFVQQDQGTGFVHIAPGHGEDDYDAVLRYNAQTEKQNQATEKQNAINAALNAKNNLTLDILDLLPPIEIPATVGPDGTYYDSVPLFAGKHVYWPNGKTGDANKAVIAALTDAHALLGQAPLVHSYPHSWRSKAPLIFRTTPQWFIGMEKNDLREKALKAIAETKWYPPQGQNRIGAMIETRPDWCISRQRAWGVPIAVFVETKSGEVLRDQAVVDRIAAAFEKDGADAWYAHDPAEFLGPGRDPQDYEQIKDVVDVWFDSGSTHSFVLERRPDLCWPASLYLEGSDQHRGWFHSSLLESCGTRGRAPYEAVLTHGFVLDEQGRKMSKSLGNVVAPQQVVSQSGADILRLWVVASDYSEDLRIGPEILKYQADVYRRLRNTLRYLLGAVAGFSEAERVAPSAMPELERYILHRLAETDALVRQTAEAYDFHTMFTVLHNLCAVDLSAFYFDVRKDALYCDAPDAARRRATRTVLDHVFEHLVRWLAPVLCFTAEEAWLSRHGDAEESSVHLQLYRDIPAGWRDEALGAKWAKIRELRRVVTGAIELERAQKRIGSSLQASVEIFAAPDWAAPLAGIDLPELCITSAAALKLGDAPADAFTLGDVPGVGARVTPAPGDKCERCWRVLPEVGADKAHADLCQRCAEAVENFAGAGQ